MQYIPCLPYIPNIPYFPNMPYQTHHTHHTYPTYHTTPPPHHRAEGDSTTPPPHHRGGRGRSHMGAYMGPIPWGGRGGWQGLVHNIYINIYIYYITNTNEFGFIKQMWIPKLWPVVHRDQWWYTIDIGGTLFSNKFMKQRLMDIRLAQAAKTSGDWWHRWNFMAHDGCGTHCRRCVLKKGCTQDQFWGWGHYLVGDYLGWACEGGKIRTNKKKYEKIRKIGKNKKK